MTKLVKILFLILTYSRVEASQATQGKVSDDKLAVKNTVAQNTVAQNTVAQNTVAQNTVAKKIASKNGANEKSVKLKKSSCNAPRNPKVIALVKKGILLEEAGDISGAIEMQKKVIEIEPENECALNTIAGLYGVAGKFEEELVFANKAIKANSKYLPAYINQGNAYQALGKPRESEAAFKQAKILEPRSPVPVYSLGVLAEEKKDYMTALSYYRQSVQLDPNFENGYFNLAACYANLKQFEKASDTLKTLLKLNPKAQDASEMLRQVELEMEKSTGRGPVKKLN